MTAWSAGFLLCSRSSHRGVSMPRTPASFSGFATRRMVCTRPSVTSRTSAEIGSTASGDHDAGLAVDARQVNAHLARRPRPDRPQEPGRLLLAHDGDEEPRHLLRPQDGAPGRERLARRRRPRASRRARVPPLALRDLRPRSPRGSARSPGAARSGRRRSGSGARARGRGRASRAGVPPLPCVPRTSAISAWGIPNASLRTNTARSSGESVSSTTSIAIETDSAIAASSAGSCLVRMGSGSQGPT